MHLVVIALRNRLLINLNQFILKMSCCYFLGLIDELLAMNQLSHFSPILFYNQANRIKVVHIYMYHVFTHTHTHTDFQNLCFPLHMHYEHTKLQAKMKTPV